MTTGEGAAAPGRRSDTGHADSLTAGEDASPATTAPAGGVPSTGGAAAPTAPRPGRRTELAPKAWIAFSFLFPALLLLAVLVLYPILYSVKRSMFDALGTHFVGLSNYRDMFTSPDTRTAIKNNAIWVLVAPIVVTALGLIFAVLTERVKWSTAFKTVVFMPMAISFLATGIIFRLVYDADPSRGLANAVISGIHDIFSTAAHYPGGRPRGTQVLTAAPGGGYQTTTSVSPGGTILLPLVGVAADDLPKNAQDAIAPSARSGAVNGAVWFDFSRGGRGTPGSVDRGEKALPGIDIQALQNGKVVASAKSDSTGRFSFYNLGAGSYTLRLPPGTSLPGSPGRPGSARLWPPGRSSARTSGSGPVSRWCSSPLG